MRYPAYRPDLPARAADVAPEMTRLLGNIIADLAPCGPVISDIRAMSSALRARRLVRLARYASGHAPFQCEVEA